MLTRPQLQAHLLALGFTAAASPPSDETPLTYANLQVHLLDAPRLLARSAKGELVYLAATSASQLEEQLTRLLGYARPA